MTGMETVGLLSASFAANPHDPLAALRDRAPVVLDDDVGYWLVSRYDDIRAVLLDPTTFPADNAADPIDRLSLPALRALERVGFTLPAMLANNSTESHRGLRSLVTGFIGSRAARAATPLIEELVEGSLDQLEVALAADGACDLVRTLARDLPLITALRVFGVEQGEDPDCATLARWSDAALQLFWGRADVTHEREAAESVAEFYSWAVETVRASTPGDTSLVGALGAHRLPDGAQLSEEEVVAAFFFMVVASQATTKHLIGTAFLRALEDRSLWQRLPKDPELGFAWLDEVLRREPPVTAWRRVTRVATQLSGVNLPAGAPLLLMLAGAGSDPAIFEAPEQICPHRPNTREHLAFGLGTHRCPGAELARIEAQVVLRAAAQRFPSLRLAHTDDPPPMLSLLSFRGPVELVVRR